MAPAAANTAHMARFICAGDTSPEAVARCGPLRSAVSAPRSKSNTSLAKFAPTCSRKAPTSAARAGPGANLPAAQATPVPTATGAAEAASVAGRIASHQARRLLTAARGSA